MGCRFYANAVISRNCLYERIYELFCDSFFAENVPVNDSTCFISLSLASLFLIKYAAPSPSAVMAILFIILITLLDLFLFMIICPSYRILTEKSTRRLFQSALRLDIEHPSLYN